MIPSYDKRVNRKVRVFISSTFSDMQYERNIIVNSVFPRLRKEFSSKLIDITEVDLRWGIPEESSENSKVLEICIGEVLRCSPYFVGIVGGEYGSTATDEAINNLPPAYKKALGDLIPSGLSISELEMRAGVFVPNNVEFSCFFMRDGIISGERLQPEVKRLLEIIRDGYEIHFYQNELDFEERLYASLRDYILKVIPDNLEIPYNDQSYYSHLKILKNNTYRYIEDTYFITGITRKINKYRRIYIQAGKGLGKSACISHLAKEEGVERDGDVFFHYASAGNQSANADDVFFRLKLYLQATFGYISSERDNHSAVIDILSSGYVDRRVVFFVDALDQMNDVTLIYKLFALTDLNANVHVVCTGIETYSRIMGDQVVTVNRLNSDQILKIVNGTLVQYGKRLGRRMTHELLQKENCTNPLFLRALLSQLIMYGTYSTFDVFFERLLQAHDFGELFYIVIDRIKNYFEERKIDKEKVYLAIGLIVYSNNGIMESELQDILRVLPVARSVFLTAIDLFVIEDNGLIKFNHDLIIRAAKDLLNQSGNDYEIIVAEELIKYFEKKEGDWRKYSELPYQLCKIGDMDKLQSTICFKDCFFYLSKFEFHSLIGYLSHLVMNQGEIVERLISALNVEEKIKTAEIMCLSGCHSAAISILDELVEEVADSEKKIEILDIIARSQYKMGINNFKESINTYNYLIDYYKTVHPNDEVGYATRAYLLGVAYQSAGDFVLSSTILKECADIFNKYEICSATSLWALVLYGQVCYHFGKIKEALEILDKVISDCKYLFGDSSSELAWSYCYGWNILYSVGDKANAFQMISNAYEIYNHLYLGRGSKMAWAAVNAGTAAMMMGNSGLAEEYYGFSIHENDCIIPEQNRPHVYSITIYNNLAVLYEKINLHNKAAETIDFALKESIEKNGSTHVYTAGILLNSGIIDKDSNRILEAIEIYNIQPFFTPDLYFAKVCLSRIYALTGRSVEASEIIGECAKSYFCEKRETDFITYLILDTVEKITGDLTEDMIFELDSLYRYEDYTEFMSSNNNSLVILIPDI